MEARRTLGTRDVHATLRDLDAQVLLEALATRAVRAGAHHRKLVFVQRLVADGTVEKVARF